MTSSSKPRLYLNGPHAPFVLRQAIGDYYDVRVERKEIHVRGKIVHDRVIAIYPKGSKKAVLSFWYC